MCRKTAIRTSPCNSSQALYVVTRSQHSLPHTCLALPATLPHTAWRAHGNVICLACTRPAPPGAEAVRCACGPRAFAPVSWHAATGALVMGMRSSCVGLQVFSDESAATTTPRDGLIGTGWAPLPRKWPAEACTAAICARSDHRSAEPRDSMVMATVVRIVGERCVG